VKQTFVSTIVFGVLGLASLAAAGGCSSEPEGSTNPTSGGNGNAAGSFSSGGSSAGSFNTSSGSGGGSVTPITGGTFGSGTAGTPSTGGGGAATGGGGAGGGTAGTATGGTGGGAPAADFPPNCPAPAASHSANKVTRTCWKASATECSLGNDVGLVNPPSAAIDADIATRYSSGDKMDASLKFNFDIDMGKAIMIDGVSTATAPPANGGTTNDIPPNIQVAVSTDGTAWTPVACTAAALSNDIAFAPVSARYVRLVQHGIQDSWWSMIDINVFRSGADDTCTGGETAACTSIGTADAATCCGVSNKL
jgi:hypothetical protein